MATNAYGQDFWIGKRFRSKDSREYYRHVVIVDLRKVKAKCHTVVLPFSRNKMMSRGSMISLKNLATRWEPCAETRPCSFCVKGNAGVE